MTREMLINNLESQECRIAVVDDGHLQELYVERSSNASRVGNVYKGKITNIEPGIQAAFVDFGAGKNGFLHISDVHPSHFPKGKATDSEAVGCKQSQRHRPPIQQCYKRGQEVVVQMTKEGIGTKGATLTTYLSIPGRLLVMMPGMSKLGVSRKIEDEETRAKAREMLDQLTLPDDMGFIVRTAGLGSTKRDLQRDLDYLLRLWKSIQARSEKVTAPAEIYQESDLVIRTLRDIYNRDIERVICDSAAVARKVLDFVSVIMPRGTHKVEVSTDPEGLFRATGLDEEIEEIHSRKVNLPSGGSLVIDQTEALVAIDVNSGRMRQHSDSETTALKTNVEAAKEIGRQLRLRDMGGLIVMDFIDLYQEKHRTELEKALRDAVKDDRAKTKILKISPFGIIQMTRQRLRPSLKQSVYRTCEHCEGTGLVKSAESQTLDVMRVLQTLNSNETIKTIDLTVSPEVASYLGNAGRGYLYEMERATGQMIVVHASASMLPGQVEVVCRNARGSQVPWQKAKGKSGSKSGGKSGGKVATLSTVDVRDLPEGADAPVPSNDPEDGDDDERPISGNLTTIEGESTGEAPTKSKRKRRRRRKKTSAESNGTQPTDVANGGGDMETPAEGQAEAATEPAAEGAERPIVEGEVAAKPKRKRRRRKKPAGGTEGVTDGVPASDATDAPDELTTDETQEPAAVESVPSDGPPAEEGEATPKRKRRRRRKKPATENAETPAPDAAPGVEPEVTAAETAVEPKAEKPKPRRRRKKVVAPDTSTKSEAEVAEPVQGTSAKKPAKKAAKKTTRKGGMKASAKSDDASDEGAGEKSASIVDGEGHIKGAAPELDSAWPLAT